MSADTHVPSSGDAGKATPLSERDLVHRESFVRYVLEDAEEWHREHLGALYSLWREWNEEHYDGQLVEPYIMLNEPSNPRRLGDCGNVSGFGGRSQIRIRPSLLTGTYPRMRHAARFAEGRFRYAADVLLHEMIHQWQHEVVGNSEESYHGHGTIFRDKANEISARLGLGRVRANRKDGKDKDLPICSQWPGNVRDGSHYLGALVPSSGDKPKLDKPKLDKPKRVLVPLDIEQAIPVLQKHFDVDELCRRLG